MITDEQIQSNLHTDFEREFARQALSSEINSYTQAERDALSPTSPRIIMNTTSGSLEGWTGDSWINLGTDARVDNLEYNLGVNSLRDAVNGGYAYFNMVGGVGDVYTDETGIDTGAAVSAVYNAIGDYYAPPPPASGTLLIQSETTDGSTTFSDAIGSKTITTNGDVQHDTDQANFGSSSILFDGTGDYLSLANSSDFYLGNGEFTIDAWIRVANVTGIKQVISHSTNFNTDGFGLFINNADLFFQYGTTVATNTVSSTSPISANTWHHVAAVRSGDTLTIYVDGVSVGTNDMTGDTVGDPAGVLTVGRNSYLDQYPFNGHMEEVRLLIGTAAWTTGFTPPSSPYSLNVESMTLPSIDFASGLASVSNVRPVMLYEPIDATTLNTDLILEVSRDSGTTWTAATLETDAVFSGAVIILVADEVDITGQPAGTTVTYRVRTLNEKDIRIHGVYLQWR